MTMVKAGILHACAFAALMGLLALAYWVGFRPWGGWRVVASLAVAGAKASVILFVYMHLRTSKRLVWVAAAAGLFMLLHLMVLTFNDYWTRFPLP